MSRYCSALQAAVVATCCCYLLYQWFWRFSMVPLRSSNMILFADATRIGYKDLETADGSSLDLFFRFKPSVNSWDTVNTPKKFAITTMVLEHHRHGSWYLPYLHDRHSIGWNRTVAKPFMGQPAACNLRFFGVGLQSTLEGFETGGTGYLAISFKNENGKQFWHGFDRNETNKVHCYYDTNKDRGSEFIDTPKTLGLAIYCPLAMDDEVGPHIFTKHMHQGLFCRPLADYDAEVELHLRPSAYQEPVSGVLTKEMEAQEVIGEIITSPMEQRAAQIKSIMREGRNHAVCTVQTFRNQYSAAMLFMFVKYYQMMGWRVIVYDRFGMHRKELHDLLKLPGVDYYPFTLYQLAQPSKYSKEYASTQSTELKTFYKMEANWGYSSKKLADTADQDADKSRTYDYARLEYMHLDMILYADADEIFFCPQATESLATQKKYQHQLMNQFHNRGVEEMRFVRLPYSGRAWEGFENTQENRAQTDFTNHTGTCMNTALQRKSLKDMIECWSTGAAYDNFPKSADFAGKCPFHYNHWSCDGMKGGGRDFTKNRCRCKVSFEMQNGFQYKPLVKNCHLMHFNDNKYRFQSNRMKHVYDLGDVTKPCSLAKLFQQRPK